MLGRLFNSVRFRQEKSARAMSILSVLTIGKKISTIIHHQNLVEFSFNFSMIILTLHIKIGAAFNSDV